jgi:hypothetical protein
MNFQSGFLYLMLARHKFTVRDIFTYRPIGPKIAASFETAERLHGLKGASIIILIHFHFGSIL